MEDTPKKQSFVVDLNSLPPLFPTHLHSAEFWEQLGRTVATFGHLEEVLGKAIFALTATVRYDEAEIQGAFERWLPTLERALTDPLGGLIEIVREGLPQSSGRHVRQSRRSAGRTAARVRNSQCPVSRLMAKARRRRQIAAALREPPKGSFLHARGHRIPAPDAARCGRIGLSRDQFDHNDGLAVSRHEGSRSRHLSAELVN